MQLHKTLTLGAAALAAGLLGLAPAAHATVSGGPIASVWVNGVAGSPNTDIPIDGIFTNGTVSFAGGGTHNCVAGTVDGIVDRGPRPVPTGQHDMVLDLLDIDCATPLGISATVSAAGECIYADFEDDNVHTGTVDTHTDNTQGHQFDRVAGLLTIPPGCATIDLFGGFCSADVWGTVPAYFDEHVKAVSGSNYQELHLDGAGLALHNQSFGCFGQMTGAFALNDITFDIKVSAGTTSGIDFRP